MMNFLGNTVFAIYCIKKDRVVMKVKNFISTISILLFSAIFIFIKIAYQISGFGIIALSGIFLVMVYLVLKGFRLIDRQVIELLKDVINISSLVNTIKKELRS